GPRVDRPCAAPRSRQFLPALQSRVAPDRFLQRQRSRARSARPRAGARREEPRQSGGSGLEPRSLAQRSSIPADAGDGAGPGEPRRIGYGDVSLIATFLINRASSPAASHSASAAIAPSRAETRSISGIGHMSSTL